jgi:pyruvate, water dikinase
VTFVVPLDRLGATDRNKAGGKAASLGELMRAGIGVPRGFVVTTAAFGRAMAALAVAESQDPPADLRGRITVAPVPADVAAEIATGYARLGGGIVAVRSSATMEDGAEASYAGLCDTYLAVRGLEAVLDRVRACWASLYNDESVAYRRRIGLPERDLAMAVVVQEMVSPRAAGVMFTRSPLTGDRSVVAIEGTWGLGSVLVAGEVTPDGFTVSKVTGEITGCRLGAKQRIHSFDSNGVGITVRDTPSDLRGRPCLTDGQVRELARLGRRVEDHYGASQDIEWALLRDGRIVLLQARPETVWAARDPAPVAAPRARASDHVLDMFGTVRRWS